MNALTKMAKTLNTNFESLRIRLLKYCPWTPSTRYLERCTVSTDPLSTSPEPPPSAVLHQVPQSTLLPAPQVHPAPVQHGRFSNQVRQVANSQKVRVWLKGLPSANNKDFRFVNESLLAKVIHITFNVSTDATGSTCAIYPAANKNGKRSGHIDVPGHVANVIAAKVAGGVKLELMNGPRENPKV